MQAAQVGSHWEKRAATDALEPDDALLPLALSGEMYRVWNYQVEAVMSDLPTSKELLWAIDVAIQARKVSVADRTPLHQAVLIFADAFADQSLTRAPDEPLARHEQLKQKAEILIKAGAIKADDYQPDQEWMNASLGSSAQPPPVEVHDPDDLPIEFVIDKAHEMIFSKRRAFFEYLEKCLLRPEDDDGNKYRIAWPDGLLYLGRAEFNAALRHALTKEGAL